jgi:AdoMet-dependent heme synthase
MNAAVELKGEKYPGYVFGQKPQNVYWETTIACDLACKHCRANANVNRHPEELTFEQALRMMRDVKQMGSLLVLTGGDPMKREDLFDLIGFAQTLSLSTAITPATTPLVTRDSIRRFRDCGVTAMGISLDGPNAAVHDAFRNVEGTFERTIDILRMARDDDLPVQINTSVTKETFPYLNDLYQLLRDTLSPPVRRWSLFLLVPVGRGTQLGVPSAADVEKLLGWVYSISNDAPFHVSTVEAPHYRRYWVQQKVAQGVDLETIQKSGRKLGFGIRDGNGIVFVSHLGEVFPAGFLPYPLLGNVKEQSLLDIYQNNDALKKLRDANNLKGRCGRCDYRWICGGSRARAYAMLGDPFQEDPLCAYIPR